MTWAACIVDCKQLVQHTKKSDSFFLNEPDFSFNPC